MSIEKLPTSASLKEVMDKFEEISFQEFGGMGIIIVNQLPSKGKEGLLYIVTDVKPSNVYMSIDTPTLSDSDIRVVVHTDETITSYDLTNSNKTIRLRFRDIYQRQGDSEVFLYGYIYMNGKWTRIMPNQVYLFKEGTGDNTEITGGFTRELNGISVSSTLTLNSSYIAINSYTSSSTTLQYVRTVNNFDVSGYSKLIIKYKYTTNVGYPSLIGLANENTSLADSTFSVSHTFSANSEGVLSLDIKNLNGKHYFKTLVASVQDYSKLYIYDMYLEG